VQVKAAAAGDPSGGVSATALLQRARQLLWLTLVPLLLLVLGLAAWQMHAEWRRVLDSASTEARTQRYAFEAVVRDAERHVDDLQRWMQQQFLRSDGMVDPAIAQALQRRAARSGGADGQTLDGLPELLRPGMAQLLWPPASGPVPAAVLRRTQSLAAVMEVAHQRNADFAWSYFFGWPDRHLALYPWVPSASMVEDQGAANLAEAAHGWYDYELVKGAFPAVNPRGRAYWTAPYADAGGKGLLVTRAAPVRVADQLRGVVGTDIRLDTLEALLARLPGAPWHAWVVDERGHVLADRQRSVAAMAAPAPAPASAASAAPPVPRLAERLPAGLDAAAIAQVAAAPGQALALAGQRVVAVSLAEAPWTVVLAAPQHELLRSAWPQVLPYSLIALGLLGVWAAGQALLRLRVITPLVAVFAYLQRLSADDATPAPSLGKRWQPWVDVVTRTFGAMRAAAQAERRAEALKSAIVDHAQAAVMVTDADDRIIEFNPAAVAMTGWRRDEVLGRSARDMMVPQRLHANYELGRRRMQQVVPDAQMGLRLERIAMRRDGSEFPIEVVLWTTMVDGVPYTTASVNDLSAARATAAVIARQREALRQSEKLTAMGSLLAGVAHELNNPLSIVMGRASLLEEKTEGTPLHADAQRIRAAAERCGRIVRTFLNMARNRPAQHAPVPLNELAQAAADMLGYTLRTHGVSIELRLARDLPEVTADADQIGQVVLNLIVNAQQALASHDGRRHIVVQTGREGPAEDPTQVWLSVTDSGPGVPAALREQIFDPFFTTKGEGSGTGLGLSVSRSILREHGGELSLRPAGAEGGAEFRLLLPLNPATPRAAPEARAAAESPPTA
jgi:PAS domain S-box-containing protein